MPSRVGNICILHFVFTDMKVCSHFRWLLRSRDTKQLPAFKHAPYANIHIHIYI